MVHFWNKLHLAIIYYCIMCCQILHTNKFSRIFCIDVNTVKEKFIQWHLLKMVGKTLFKGQDYCNRHRDHDNGILQCGREIELHSEYNEEK